MEPALRSGSASAKKAGVDYSVIKTFSFAPITSRAITAGLAQTLALGLTPANVRRAIEAPIARSKQQIVVSTRV